jgi:hypothetical protein
MSMAFDPEGVPRSGDPLAAELLGVLIGDVRAMTARLHGLVQRGRPSDDETLTTAGSDTDRIGWQLAVLASAAGTDVMLARREAEGLRMFLELICEALARLGRTLELPTTLPQLVPTTGGGWEATWLVGAILFETGRTCAPGTQLEWTLEPAEGAHHLRITGAIDEPLRARIEELAQRVPEAEPSFEPGGCTLAIPGPWLTW